MAKTEQRSKSNRRGGNSKRSWRAEGDSFDYGHRSHKSKPKGSRRQTDDAADYGYSFN